MRTEKLSTRLFSLSFYLSYLKSGEWKCGDLKRQTRFYSRFRILLHIEVFGEGWFMFGQLKSRALITHLCVRPTTCLFATATF